MHSQRIQGRAWGEVALGVPTSLSQTCPTAMARFGRAIRQRPIEGRERVNRSLQQSVERELIKTIAERLTGRSLEKVYLENHEGV